MSVRTLTDGLRGDQYEYSGDYLTREGRMLFLRGVIMGYPPSPEHVGRADPYSSMSVAEDIMVLSKEDPSKPIWLFIDSVGGEVTNGFMLYDTINMAPAPIYTVGVNAASMATTLMVAGKKRYITPHAKVMIHLPQTLFAGDSDELETKSKQVNRIKNELVDIFIEHGAHAGLGMTAPEKKIKNKIMKDINKEKWFNAQEALDYGLVDEILTTEMLYGKSD